MDAELVNRISAVRATLTRIDQQYEYETASIARFQSKLRQLESEKLQLVKAVALIDKTIQVVSANGIGKIESIVTGGLRAVFGKDSGLRLVVEKKETTRGNSYRLLVAQGDVVGNPMESFGGGVQNVVAFLLRVILIKRFKLPKLMVLDENFANVGHEKGHPYLKNASDMLRELCDNHGFTIFAVTHQPILAAAADNVYRVLSDEGLPPVLHKCTESEKQNLLQAVGSFEPSLA